MRDAPEQLRFRLNGSPVAVAAAPMMARMADTQYEAAAPEMNINEPGTEEIVQTVNGSVQM